MSQDLMTFHCLVLSPRLSLMVTRLKNSLEIFSFDFDKNQIEKMKISTFHLQKTLLIWPKTKGDGEKSDRMPIIGWFWGSQYPILTKLGVSYWVTYKIIDTEFQRCGLLDSCSLTGVSNHISKPISPSVANDGICLL